MHAGDCSIYSCSSNYNPKDGICDCGYGLKREREGDYSESYSEEIKEKIRLENVFSSYTGKFVSGIYEKDTYEKYPLGYFYIKKEEAEKYSFNIEKINREKECIECHVDVNSKNPDHPLQNPDYHL